MRARVKTSERLLLVCQANIKFQHQTIELLADEFEQLRNSIVITGDINKKRKRHVTFEGVIDDC
jgi:hypothetical protein